MSAFVLSLMLAAGVTAWVYNKFMNRTGNVQQTAMIASGVTGVVVFIVGLLIFNSLDF